MNAEFNALLEKNPSLKEGYKPFIALKESVDGITKNFLDNIRAYSPIRCIPDVVMFQNSLQVSFANRYLISSRDDFSLAKRMIADNQEYKQGLTPKAG